jgi:hypothetical protein
VVEGPVPGDRRGPAAERVEVAAEGAYPPGDLQPGVGRDVLGVIADKTAQVAQEAGLHVPVQQPEGVLVAVLRGGDGIVDRRPQALVPTVIARDVCAGFGQRATGTLATGVGSRSGRSTYDDVGRATMPAPMTHRDMMVESGRGNKVVDL